MYLNAGEQLDYFQFIVTERGEAIINEEPTNKGNILPKSIRRSRKLKPHLETIFEIIIKPGVGTNSIDKYSPILKASHK